MRRPLILLLVFLAALAAAGPASAATFQVNSQADTASDGVCDPAPGGCTVRDAVAVANTAPGDDVVSVPAGTYNLASGPVFSFDPAVVTIKGAGRAATTFSGPTGAFFNAGNAGTGRLELADLKVTGTTAGNAVASQAAQGLGLTRVDVTGSTAAVGTAVLNITGPLDITDSTVSDNTGAGAVQQGSGKFTVTRSRVERNSAGGVLELGGELALDHATVSGNGSATSSNGGVLSLTSKVMIVDSAISDNASGSTGGGLSLLGSTGVEIVRTTIAGNSSGQAGGGVLDVGGASTSFTDSTVRDNTAPSQGGGGILSGNGQALTLTRTTVSGNSAGSDTTSSSGGGIAVFQTGSVSIVDSTITQNTARAPAGSGGSGGGIFIPGSSLTLTNDTVSQNTAAGATGSGGNIFTFGATVKNTIVSGGTAAGGENCGPTGVPGLLVSQGHNIESADTCGLTGTGDLINTDPKLGPLASNGGFTQTRALLLGSPAIDAGDNSGCPVVDQRGIARPQDVTCDIGAFELVRTADLGVTQSAPKQVTAGKDFTYSVTVTNKGPYDTAATLGLTLPSGVTAHTAATPCSGAAKCSLGTLAAGAIRTLKLVARASKVGTLTSVATVTGSRPDPTTTDNTSRTNIAVAGAAVKGAIAALPRSCVSHDFTARFRVSGGTAPRSAQVLLDGRTLARTARTSFAVRVRARHLRPGRHRITLLVRSAGGRSAKRSSTFARCAAVRPTPPPPRFTG